MAAPKKLTELPSVAKANSDFKFVGVNDPSGVPTTVTVTANSLFSNVVVSAAFSANATFASFVTANTVTISTLKLLPSTPVTNADAVAAGTVWYDTNYMYVAVANNSIKRVALTTF